MSTTIAKSILRSIAARRSFSATAARRYDAAREAEKWEKITIAGIIICAVLSIYNLKKGHREYPEPPPYPYLRIQKKEFPWGPDPLFEHIKKRRQQQSKH